MMPRRVAVFGKLDYDYDKLAALYSGNLSLLISKRLIANWCSCSTTYLSIPYWGKYSEY